MAGGRTGNWEYQFMSGGAAHHLAKCRAVIGGESAPFAGVCDGPSIADGNAALIAAAPDLLAALKAALPLLIGHQESASKIARCKLAIDAIAKAEGRP